MLLLLARAVPSIACTVAAIVLGVPVAADAPAVVGPKPAADVGKVRVTDCAGHSGPGRVLRRGECVLVAAPGFTPHEAVRARLLSIAATSTQAMADGHGVLRYRLVIDQHAASGNDVLTLVGLGAPAAAPAAAGANISVTIPRFVVLRYRVETD